MAVHSRKKTLLFMSIVYTAVQLMILKHTGLSVNVSGVSTNETKRTYQFKTRNTLYRSGRRTLDMQTENDPREVFNDSEVNSRSLISTKNATPIVRITSDKHIYEYRNNTDYDSFRSRAPIHLATKNVDSFRYLLNTRYLCSDPEEPETYLLVLVVSHPGNKVARNAIRDTWGSFVRHHGNGTYIKVIFLLGIGEHDDETNKAIQRESRLYRDIVQANFIDSYGNLTLKTLMGLNWARKFCPNTRYILKTDDDTMIHVPALFNILAKQEQRNLILGSVNTNSLVMRKGRWKISRDQYPATTYPPYCNGAAYVLSVDVAWRICDKTRSVPLFPLEDVYVTGIVPRALGLVPVAHPSFGFWTTRLDHPCDMVRKAMVSAHALPPETLYMMWDAMMRRKIC